MPEYDIKDGVHCADFIGGDKNITYGFRPEDVESLIEKVAELMGGRRIFTGVRSTGCVADRT